jgi:hypothetical protein
MFQSAQRISVFVLATVGLYAQTAITPPLQVARTSGMVGIAEGQSARLNALNPGDAPTSTAAGCSALLAFLGDDGKVLKSAIVNVTAGAGAHIDIDSDKDLALAVNARREIRATITIPPAPPPTATSTTPVKPVCKLIGTLEIFDTLNGHTLVSLGVGHPVPNPVATPGS